MTAETLADPFAAGATDDIDDPFATADEAKSSGTFIPRPRIEALRDRLVVIVPREFDKEAKVSEHLQREYNMEPTREEWTTDLVILPCDGSDFSYDYRGKVKDEDKKNPDGPDEYVEMTWTVAAAELPYLIPGWKASWGNIIGALNAITAKGKPMAFGHVRAGYAIATMRKGKTFADFAAEEEAYYTALAANPRAKLDKPTPRWHFEVSEDPKDKALAASWWQQARADGYKLS